MITVKSTGFTEIDGIVILAIFVVLLFGVFGFLLPDGHDERKSIPCLEYRFQVDDQVTTWIVTDQDNAAVDRNFLRIMKSTGEEIHTPFQTLEVKPCPGEKP